jgi:hypothetical protein
VTVTGTVSTSSDVAAAENTISFYGTAAEVVDTGTGTITYTTGTADFSLKNVMVSSSGAPCRVDVTYTLDPGGTPTVVTLATAFYATTSPFVNLTWNQPFIIGAGLPVSAIITNNAGSTQDVFATIIGYQGT